MQSRKLLEDNILIKKPGVLDKKLQFNVNSSLMVRVTSMSKDDVDELSFEIGVFLNTVKFDVGNILNLQNIGSVQVSPGQQVDQNGWSGKYVATVSMTFTYAISRRWRPVDTGALLKEVSLKLSADAAYDKDDVDVLIYEKLDEKALARERELAQINVIT